MGKVSRTREREGKATDSLDKSGQALAADREFFQAVGSQFPPFHPFGVVVFFFPIFFSSLCTLAHGSAPAPPPPSPEGSLLAGWASWASSLMALAPGSVPSLGRVMGHPLALPSL